MTAAERAIRERLRGAGRITFAEFMAAALYGPGGYYTERPALGGAGGDYFTSPELHPVFGALVGRQVAEVWAALGRPARFELVEAGPGSGALARDLLTWAEHEAPDFSRAIHYLLVEPSAPARAAQQETLQAAGLLDDRIGWDERSALGLDQTIVGCLIANELVDAFPVHLVAVRDDRLVERYVALADDSERFVLVEDAPSTPRLAAYFADVGVRPGEGCTAEVNLCAVDWATRAAASLARGALLVLDYGYPAAELYAPHRRHGTLLCYRGHTLNSDPLSHVGRQDVTSHVDFTALARAGARVGLTTIGPVDQATFLTGLGLRDYLRLLDAAAVSASEHEANRRALTELIRRDGLGTIKVMLGTRGLPDFRPTGLGARTAAAPAWLPLLRPEQMRLPGPIEAAGFGDLEAQWREFWTASDGKEDAS